MSSLSLSWLLYSYLYHQLLICLSLSFTLRRIAYSVFQLSLSVLLHLLVSLNSPLSSPSSRSLVLAATLAENSRLVNTHTFYIPSYVRSFPYMYAVCYGLWTLNHPPPHPLHPPHQNHPPCKPPTALTMELYQTSPAMSSLDGPADCRLRSTLRGKCVRIISANISCTCRKG